MKKIVVSLLVLFASVSCFAQPITRRAMDVNTVSDARLDVPKNLFIPKYADTTAANLAKGIDSCSAIIFTYDNNTQWIRACNPKRWVKAAGSVVVDNTATVNLSGDGSTATPLTADVNLSSTGQNAIVALADGLYVPNSVRNGLVWGGTVTWVSGYTYSVAEAFYYINGAPFHSPTTTITLDPSDNDSSRIDLIVVNSQNLVAVVKGDLSTSPLEPTIDPSTQLRLSIVLVQAGTTEPTNNGTGLRRECIYQENTEWTTASSNARINPNSTNAPCVGSKDVEGTGVLNGDYVRFTRPSGNITLLDSFQVITFQLKSKAGWGNNRKLILRWQSSGVNVGGVVNLTGASYGWSSNLTGVCQTISIPLVDFGLPAGASVNQLLITASVPNGSIGFYLDQMCLQNQEQPSYATPITLQNGLNLDANTNIGELGGTLLHNTTNSTGYFVHTLSGISVYNYPYQFQQGQNFGNGTGVTSFLSSGAVVPTSPDYQNQVRLGINYTSATYQASPLIEGYFGDRIGYMLNTNLRGHGSFGMYQDDYKAKNVGIFFHTRDNLYRDGVTIFAADSSNVAGDYSGSALKTHKAAIFKTTGALQLPKYGVGTFTGTSTYALYVDANGNLIEGAAGGAITADNGLTANTSSNVRLGGTLMQTTTINSAGYTLSVTGTIDGSGTPILNVNNSTTSGGVAIKATNASPFQAAIIANGNAYGVSSSGYTGIYTVGTNIGLQTENLSGGLAMIADVQSASTNTVLSISKFVASSSGTPANGIGGALDFYTETTVAEQLSNRIISKWADATDAARTSQYEVWGVNSSVTARKLAIAGNGKLTLDGYGSGAQTGTATYGLAVDASGNVIEGSLLTADNGLTKSAANNVQLGSTTPLTGSPLLHDTYLNGSTFTLTMYSDAATGVSIQNTNNGTALYTQSGTGFGLKTFSNSISAQFQTRTSSTNTIEPIIQVQRRTFGTPAAGMGGSIDFYLDAVTPITEISNQLISKWTDATDATRSAQFEIWGVNSGVNAVKFIVKPNGIINIPTAPPSYANNAAAITGGLSVGDLYMNGDALQIVH